MRSVEEQLAAVIDAAVAPEPIRVALTDALGLRCAEEIAATRQVPGCLLYTSPSPRDS